MKNILTKKEIEEEFEKKCEERIQNIEETYGKKLSEHGREKVRQRILSDMEKDEKIKKSLKRIAIGTGVGAIALTAVLGMNSCGRDNEPTEETVIGEDENKEHDVIGMEENLILEKIVENYNKQYPDTPITVEQLGLLKSEPNFLIKGEDEEGIDKYTENFRITGDELGENEEFIYTEPGNKFENYIVVNNDTNRIVYSLGMIGNEVSEIDTKTIMANNKEYTSDGKKAHIEYESEAEKAMDLIDLKHKYENRVIEKSQNQIEDEGMEH